MKNIILILLITVFTTSIYAQRRPGSAVGMIKTNWHKKGWFMDGNIGARFMGKTSIDAEMSTGLSMNGAFGYTFSEYVGIRGRMDYNGFKVSPGFKGVSNKSHAIGMSVEGVLKLLNILGPTKSRDYDINFHAGLGFTTMFNPEYKRYVTEELGREFEDPFFKGNDDVFHVVWGATAQYHLNSNFSLNLDFSHFIHMNQYLTYDTFNRHKVTGVTGLLGVTFGLTFRF